MTKIKISSHVLMIVSFLYSGLLYCSETEFIAKVIKNIGPDDLTCCPADLTNVYGTLFLYADDGVHGEELWKSDDTAAGTLMVNNIVQYLLFDG